MSASPTPPPLRSLPRYRPVRRGPGGRALGVAAVLVGLVAAGRAAWLARARRRFAGLRGPRFDKAVGAPALHLDATVVVGDDAAGAAPVVDATVVEGERSFSAQATPEAILDATVVDEDEPDADAPADGTAPSGTGSAATDPDGGDAQEPTR